jgi:nicotinamide phosphoribosyltransferase
MNSKNGFNLILDTDSYKSSHFMQYPPDTQGQFSYFESRGGQYDKTVFFGLQYLMKKYLSQPITEEHVQEAWEFFKSHGEPFNLEGWMHIVKDHGGKLPIRIQAVPEGCVIPTHNVLMTVENTCPKCAWVTSYVETILVRLWYPITVASRSWYAKKKILDILNQTSDDPRSNVMFKLHDFGSRGVSSMESAAIGGAAHLINFMGSDTVVGVKMLRDYYNIPMAGFSIPAAEHSTITAWGKDGELDAYRNMIKQFAKPGSIVACVSDSYNIWDAAERLWGEELRQAVIDSGATIVIRPDSGNPAEVVFQLLQIMERKFGVTMNKMGYKVLNHVRIIQGDGVNEESIREVLTKAAREGQYSADNINFGMGGGLLQQLNRDTQRFAYKCSAVRIGSDNWKPVSKDPITDPIKKSKSGRLILLAQNGQYRTTTEDEGGWANVLRPVFFNGEVLIDEKFDVIRARAAAALDKEAWNPYNK